MTKADRPPQPPGLDMGAFKEQLRTDIEKVLAKLQGTKDNRNISRKDAAQIIKEAQELVRQHNALINPSAQFGPIGIEASFVDTTIDGKEIKLSLRQNGLGLLQIFPSNLADVHYFAEILKS